MPHQRSRFTEVTYPPHRCQTFVHCASANEEQYTCLSRASIDAGEGAHPSAQLCSLVSSHCPYWALCVSSFLILRLEGAWFLSCSHCATAEQASSSVVVWLGCTRRGVRSAGWVCVRFSPQASRPPEPARVYGSGSSHTDRRPCHICFVATGVNPTVRRTSERPPTAGGSRLPRVRLPRERRTPISHDMISVAIPQLISS